MSKPLRHTNITERERQNLESLRSRDAQKAIYFTINASEKQKIIGIVPRDSIIIQPTVVYIIERFDSSNIWIKIGTQKNIESVGKIIAHNIGIFNLQPTGFSIPPEDYGRIFQEEKVILVSIVTENVVQVPPITVGRLIGVLFYTDLTQVQGYK